MEDSLLKVPVSIIRSSDILPEQHLFEKIIQIVNQRIANKKGIVLLLAGDDIGKASQSAGISGNCNPISSGLAVILLWKKWYCPDGCQFDENYQRVMADCRNIRFYFRGISDDILADPGEQVRKVLDFRDKIEGEKRYPVKHYEEEAELLNLLTEDLSRWLGGVPSTPGISHFGMTTLDQIITGSTIVHFTDEIHRLAQIPIKDYHFTEACSLAERACQKVDNGLLSRAEEYLAKAVSISFNPVILRNYGSFLELIENFHKAEQVYLKLLWLGEETKSRSVIAEANLCLGMLNYKKKKPETASVMLNLALDIFEEEGMPGKAADGRTALGLLLLDKEPESAGRLLEQALQTYTDLGMQDKFVVPSIKLGCLYIDRGEKKKATVLLEKALLVEKKTGRQKFAADLCVLLANVQVSEGSLNAAVRKYKEALSLYGSLGENRNIANIYCQLGSVYSGYDDHGFAKKMFELAFEIYEKIFDREGELTALIGLGELYFKLEELKLAKEVFKKVVLTGLETCRPEMLLKAYLRLGKIYFIWEMLEESEAMYLEAVDIIKDSDQMEALADCHTELGKIYFKKKDCRIAESHFNKALDIWKGFAGSGEISEVYGLLGDVNCSLGQLQIAVKMYKEAISADSAAGTKERSIEFFFKLGKLYLDSGKATQSKKAFLQALQISEILGRKESSIPIYTELGVISFELGDVAAAVNMYSKAIEICLEKKLHGRLSEPCINLGHIYFKQQNFKMAEHTYLSAINYSDTGEHKLISVYANLGKIYMYKGNMEKAEGMKERVRVLVMEKVAEIAPSLLMVN